MLLEKKEKIFMKEKYETPQTEVLLLDEEDVILTSGADEYPDGSGMIF